MRNKRITLFLMVIAAATTGCATGGFHQVSFAGESSAAAEEKKPGQTVYVVPNGQMKDSLLEARIRTRLEVFLLDRGYVIASPDTAELYILATFGAGERLVASIASVFRPAEVKVQRDPNGNVVRRTINPDRMEMLRVPNFENHVWLQVLSSDANYFRETGMVKNLWRGEASMRGKAESLPNSAAYLLVPAMKFFGKETRQVVTMDVRDGEIAWR